MLKRRIIDYKITTPNPELFVRLGNVFPVNSLFYHVIYDYEKSSFRLLGRLLTDVLQKNGKYYLEQLSNNYISNRKRKTLSNYLCDLIDNYGIGRYYSDDYCSIPQSAFEQISIVTVSRYGDKWTEISEALFTDYDIIKPFSMVIDDEGEEKRTGGTTNTVKSSGKDNSTESSSGYESNSSTVSNDQTDNYVYGFNSGLAVPTDSSKNNSRTTDYMNNNDDTDSTTTMSREKTDNFVDNRIFETVRNIVRKGNIGNMSYQDLVNKEIKLREYILVDMIYNDLDRVFTRSKYIIGE